MTPAFHLCGIVVHTNPHTPDLCDNEDPSPLDIANITPVLYLCDIASKLLNQNILGKVASTMIKPRPLCSRDTFAPPITYITPT